MVNLIIRILSIILALVVVALATVLLLAPGSVADVIRTLEDVAFVVRLGAVLIIYVLLLVLVFLRLRGASRANDKMLMVRAAGADAAVTVESAQDLVLKTVQTIPSVAAVEAAVRSVGGKADIDLNVTTTDDKVNVPEKQREINRALEQVIKKQLGLQMAGRPRINIRLAVTPPPTPAPVPMPTGVVAEQPAEPVAAPAAAPVVPVVAAPPPAQLERSPAVDMTPPLAGRDAADSGLKDRTETEVNRAGIFGGMFNRRDEPAQDPEPAASTSGIVTPGADDQDDSSLVSQTGTTSATDPDLDDAWPDASVDPDGDTRKP